MRWRPRGVARPRIPLVFSEKLPEDPLERVRFYDRRCFKVLKYLVSGGYLVEPDKDVAEEVAKLVEDREAAFENLMDTVRPGS